MAKSTNFNNILIKKKMDHNQQKIITSSHFFNKTFLKTQQNQPIYQDPETISPWVSNYSHSKSIQSKLSSPLKLKSFIRNNVINYLQILKPPQLLSFSKISHQINIKYRKKQLIHNQSNQTTLTPLKTISRKITNYRKNKFNTSLSGNTTAKVLVSNEDKGFQNIIKNFIDMKGSTNIGKLRKILQKDSSGNVIVKKSMSVDTHEDQYFCRLKTRMNTNETSPKQKTGVQLQRIKQQLKQIGQNSKKQSKRLNKDLNVMTKKRSVNSRQSIDQQMINVKSIMQKKYSFPKGLKKLNKNQNLINDSIYRTIEQQPIENCIQNQIRLS